MTVFHPRTSALLLAAVASAMANASQVFNGMTAPRAKPVAIRNSSRRNPGPGYSHAKVKRLANKRRNVLRNRAAHRG